MTFLFPTTALFAQDSPHKVLKFITINVAPWAENNVHTQQGEGAFFDIIEQLEQRTGYHIEASTTPFARVEREMESGHHDCTILVPRPTSLVVPGELVFSHTLGAIARKEFPLRSYDDLYNLRISVLRGGSLTERFDSDENLQKKFDTDYIIGLRRIARGRADAIVGAISTLQHMAQQEGVLELFGEPLVMHENSVYLQCSRKSPHLDAMPALNRAITDMHADGTLERIQQQYRL